MTHVFGRGFPSPYLERSSHSEDTVVGLLGTQALKSLLHNLILLGDQVVGTVSPPRVSTVLSLPFPPLPAMLSYLFLPSRSWATIKGGGGIPQAQLPVSSVVEVPLAQRTHPAHQPRALHDVGGKRRVRHLGGSLAGGITQSLSQSLARSPTPCGAMQHVKLRRRTRRTE